MHIQYVHTSILAGNDARPHVLRVYFDELTHICYIEISSFYIMGKINANANYARAGRNQEVFSAKFSLHA
jgi:hypothetical protein